MSGEAFDLRLQISEGAVVTVTTAARVLGFRGADSWLRDHGLVKTLKAPDGRHIERVIWRAVLRALEEDLAGEAPTPQPGPPRLTSW